MKDHIVNLEIPMHESAPVSRLCPPRGEELHDVVKVRDLANFVLTFYISGTRLRNA